MKAVLLCAGQGTRLHPLTHSRPKHLLPVAGRAVLDHVLESLAVAGVSEAVFVVAPEAEALRECVADGSRWGMTACYVVQDSPRGLADAVRCARDYVEGERFIVYLGDNLLGEGVTEFMADFAASDAQASLVVKSVEDPRQFGVVVMEEGRVTRLVEKPADPPSDLAIVGVYGFGPKIFEAIGRIEPSARGELEITDAMYDLLMNGERVDCHVTDGFWADAGSPAAVLAANEYYLRQGGQAIAGEVTDCAIAGPVQVAPGATVRGCRLEGPCLVSEGCVVDGSSLGPNVTLGAGCRVADSTLARTILDEDCVVEGAEAGIEDSLAGRRVRISRPSETLVDLLAPDDATIAETPEQ